jgi:hypothetical protein
MIKQPNTFRVNNFFVGTFLQRFRQFRKQTSNSAMQYGCKKGQTLKPILNYLKKLKKLKGLKRFPKELKDDKTTKYVPR